MEKKKTVKKKSCQTYRKAASSKFSFGSTNPPGSAQELI